MVQGPLDRPQSWRTAFLALAIWAGHFVAVYAAGLIFPGSPAVLWITLAASVTALGALTWLWRRDGELRTALGSFAVLLSGLFVIYDTLPPLLS